MKNKKSIFQISNFLKTKFSTMKNKKGQFDEPGIWIGLLFGLIGAAIGLIIAKKMDVNVFIRIINALVVGIICFFVGWKVADSG